MLSFIKTRHGLVPNDQETQDYLDSINGHGAIIIEAPPLRVRNGLTLRKFNLMIQTVYDNYPGKFPPTRDEFRKALLIEAGHFEYLQGTVDGKDIKIKVAKSISTDNLADEAEFRRIFERVYIIIVEKYHYNMTFEESFL
jgi:hypothetical protein